ncbi:MAG TPA: hypothetical protein VKZ59_16740 [Acidobacteriota bacterium]|nr:hypothetical protein [Acidobacteriota bacterium]
MTWIKTIPLNTDDPKLRKALGLQRSLYPKEYDVPVEAVGDESIMASHTLIPEALEHAFATLGVLLSDDLPLSRAQHEMIATVVSAVNHCHY